ncbi:MAG TPA: helix-turn-helix domain-containing protein [Planctomycetota bacterium]|jgi:excisionase family DNA binding protein|nr:helix-turn-helix domain-containing protein [Planctomycetota bacterium]
MNPTDQFVDRDRLWVPERTATFLGITVKALYQMVYRREIPFLKIGRRLRFEETRLRAWLRGKEVQP